MKNTKLVILMACCVGCSTVPGLAEKEMTMEVKRANGRVWIEGVPNKEVGYLGLLKGMHVLLTHRGEDVTLDDVRVTSGDAFHLSHGTKWELRTEHTIPTDILINAAHAYGYEAKWTQPHMYVDFKSMSEDRKKQLADEYLGQIWAQIDKGRPALVGGAYGQCSQWRVAVGYDKANGLICYVGGEKPYDWTPVIDDKVKKIGYWDAQARGPILKGFLGGWIGNAAFLLGDKKKEVKGNERAVMVLRRAVELHNAESRPYYGVTHHFGRKAYEEWSKDLDQLDYPADLKEERPGGPEIYDMSTLMYQAKQITTGRTAAADFCRTAAAEFPGAAAHLNAAATSYEEEAQLAAAAFSPFVQGSDDQREAWLSDEPKRKAGVRAILQMLAKEKAAIAEIEKALESLK